RDASGTRSWARASAGPTEHRFPDRSTDRRIYVSRNPLVSCQRRSGAARCTDASFSWMSRIHGIAASMRGPSIRSTAMKLATLREASADGCLLVVSRDLRRAVRATGIADSLRAALESWEEAAPQLQRLSDAL